MLDQNLVLKSNELFLVGNISTEHTDERATGLYARDTRHLSRFRATINGVAPRRLSVTAERATTATVICSNPLLHLANGDALAPLRLLLELHVAIGDELSVSFTLQNFTGSTLPLTFALDIGADFRDLFDIRGFSRAARGRCIPPSLSDREILLGYRGLDDLMAETLIRFDQSANITPLVAEHETAEVASLRLESLTKLAAGPGVMEPPEVRASFPIEVPAGEQWSVTATISPSPAGGVPLVSRRETPRRPAGISTSHALLSATLDRSLLDLDALQTSFPDGGVPAAGIPWFVAPFGRDSLIVGLQTYFLTPDRAIRTLRTLAALQGTKFDPEREEEPGKILHEMRYGEMARLHEIPHSPYFGSVDATPLFVWLFAEAVAWTGSRAVYEELLPNAERAIEWIERCGDLDGDGLIEYRSDGPGGARIVNQVWKDSYDSLNHVDGRPVVGPVAAVEVQGYVFAAYSRLSQVARTFGDVDRAVVLESRAESIRGSVESAFWMDELDCYAQALDGGKRQIRSLSSNPGHLLACGLPSPERGERLARRLMEPDLNSGWGIRTLAAGSHLYNPMSYHNGSVWPHDNSLIAAGLYRYGASDAGNAIAASLLDAAASDPLERLPELYCGFARNDRTSGAPVPYPVSCSPQAWAAGAIPLLLKSMLGLDVDLENELLVIHPQFPEWLSSVRIDDLEALGRGRSIQVTRTPDGYDVQQS